MTVYYALLGDGKEHGPIDVKQLHLWVSEGKIHAHTLIKAEGSNQWIPAHSILPSNSFEKGGVSLRHQKKNLTWFRVFVFGSLTFIGLCIITGIYAVLTDGTNNSGRGSSANPSPQPERVEDVIREKLQADFNQNMQHIFECFHPTGKAKSITIHEVVINQWKHGRDTNQLADIQQFTFRFTIYWEGPVTQDGFTKVEEVFDTESMRYISGKVLATNGVTNNDIAAGLEALGNMIVNRAVDRAVDNAMDNN